MNLVEFNGGRCKVLCLCWGNSKQKYRLGDEGIESSLEEKDLEVFVDKKLNMSWQCALTAWKDHTLSCIKSSGASMLRSDSPPPLL